MDDMDGYKVGEYLFSDEDQPVDQTMGQFMQARAREMDQKNADIAIVTGSAGQDIDTYMVFVRRGSSLRSAKGAFSDALKENRIHEQEKH